MGSLAVRRWRAQSKLFALVLSVAVIAGSVLTGSLLLVRSAEEAGVREALSSITADQVDVTVRMIDPGSPVADTRKAVDSAAERAYGPDVDWSSTGWVTTDWVATPADVYTYLVELDDPSAAASLVEGRWPTVAPGVAMPENAARSLGITVGDILTFEDNGTPVELHVEGLYQSSPKSGVFWENDPLTAGGNVDVFPEPNRSFFYPVHAVGPLIVAPNGVDASGVTPAQLEMTEHPSFSSADVAGLAALRELVVDAEIAMALDVAHPGGALFVNTDLGAALEAVDAGLAATRAAALMIALLVLVVVAAAVAAVTRLIVDARAAEFDLLRARGASWWQTSFAVVIDAVVVGAVVALASPWGGVLLHALIVATTPLNSAGLDRWVPPDTAAWSSSIVVAAVVAVLLCLPAAGSRGEAGVVRARAAVVAVESTVVVAAVLMLWRVSTVGPLPGDLLLAATPAVLVAAIAIVGSRVLAAAARAFARLTGRARGAILPLAGWFAARGAGRSAGVVLVALTVGASVVVLGTNATWQQSVRNQAAVAVGPPARLVPGDIDVALAGSTPPGAVPVMRRLSLLSKQTGPGTGGDVPVMSVQILGLVAEARGLLNKGPASDAGGSAIAEYLASADSRDTGPTLPAGTASLQAVATLEGPEGAVADVSVVCEDAAGTFTVVPLGSIAVGAQGVTLMAPIASGDLQTDARLVAITMRLQQDVEPADPMPVALTLDAVTTLTAEGMATSVPVALLDGGGWLGSNSDDETKPPDVTVTDSAIRLAPRGVPDVVPITYGAVGWNPMGSIDAVVPASLADDLDVGVGAELSGFIAGSPVTFRIAGYTTEVPGAGTVDDLRALEAGLPTPSRTASTIVVDGQALAHQLVQASASGPLVDEFWLTSNDAAGSFTPTGGDESLVDAVALGQRMMEAPLKAEIPAASALAVWTSVLLALAGFGARTAAITRTRRLESAHLRALGLSRRGMLGVAAADAGLIATLGIVLGLGAGLVTLVLVGTRLVSGGGGLAVDLVVPWQAVTLLPLALLGALAVIFLGIANGQRRLPLAELLRSGADG